MVFKSTDNAPDETIVPDAANVELGDTILTLVTVPEPPLPLPLDDIVTAPFAALIETPVPATILVTPVLVISTTPVLAFAFILTPLPVNVL